MKLSVCIFAYNHESYIAEAIESVLQQVTDFDYEIVIGEDCSSDSTRNIVKYYQNKYPQQIRALLNERNLGMMENYSHTITACRGEFIALMDGDDYWINNNKLQSQVDFLQANSNYSLCFHDAKILKTNKRWDQITCCGKDQKEVITFEDLICHVHIPTASLVFRRNMLGDFPPKWFGDLNAPDRPIFLMLAASGPGYYFNELWSVYRKHPKGIWTGQHYQSQWLTHLQIYKIMNLHYKGKYKKSFCKCEASVNFTLAIRLLKDNSFKRAMCCFRKYVRITRGMFSLRPDVCRNIIVFRLLYFRQRVGLLRK